MIHLKAFVTYLLDNMKWLLNVSVPNVHEYIIYVKVFNFRLFLLKFKFEQVFLVELHVQITVIVNSFNM